jgi:HK97 gp10 family phage protein
VINQREFESRLKGQSVNTTNNVIKTINKIANNVRNTAVTSILQNPRAGGQSTRYNPKRTIRISKAGDPPASDTGFLAGQIVLKIDADGLGASVISNANYSEALEFGTLKMPARPFMQPAVEENRRKYEKELSKAIQDGIK